MSQPDKFIPALLRGFTSDGELGRLIAPMNLELATGQGVLSLDPGADALASPAALSEFLKASSELKEKSELRAIQIGELAYAVAVNYDDLQSLRKEGPKADLSEDSRQRVVVVTGGAQGFGEGMVRSMAKTGHLVYVADLNVSKAQELCDEINSGLGYTGTLPVEVNVANEDSVADMIDSITQTVGGIDVFVNNAGVLKADSVKTMSSKDFEFVTDVNYRGYFYCVKSVSKAMEWMNLGAKEGYFTDIIQINSKSGLQGSNKNGAYAGGKFGGIGLTQSFAMELVADNTKVNAICPGNFFEGPLWSDPDRGLFAQYLSTGKVPGAKTIEEVKAFYESKVPMGRGCRVADVMRALYYIIEQKYETGQAIPVTGGQVMLK